MPPVTIVYLAISKIQIQDNQYKIFNPLNDFTVFHKHSGNSRTELLKNIESISLVFPNSCLVLWELNSWPKATALFKK